MPTPKRTHEESRNVVCLACFSKCKNGRKINDQQEKEIIKLLPNYSKTDPSFPSILCNNCRVNLLKNKLKIVDYETLNTRPSRKDKKRCCICKVGRLNHFEKNIFTIKNSPKKKAKNAETINICSKCFSKVGKGLAHHCTKRNKVDNILVSTADVKEQVASKTLIEIKKNALNKDNIVSLNKGRGTSLKVSILSKQNQNIQKNTQIDQEFVKDIADSCDMSDRNVQNFIAKFRKRFGKRSAESQILVNLKEKSHICDDYFEVDDILVEDGTKSYTLVYCSKLNEFVAFVLEQRKCEDDVLIKVGVDGGGGSLKVCLSIQEYSQTKNGPKDSGINKLFILAVAFGADEKYEILKLIFEKINLQSLLSCFFEKFVFVGDLKIVNLILGKNCY